MSTSRPPVQWGGWVLDNDWTGGPALLFDTDDEYIGKSWTHRSKSRLTRIQTQLNGQQSLSKVK